MERLIGSSARRMLAGAIFIALAGICGVAHALCDEHDNPCCIGGHIDKCCAAAQAAGGEQKLCCPASGKQNACCMNFKCPQPPVKGFEAPDAMVLAILYAPPGNKSDVSYAAQSSVGSRLTMLSTDQVGFGAKVTSSVLDVSSEFDSSTTDGTSFSITQSQGAGFKVLSTVDVESHAQDVFILWLHPVVSVDIDKQHQQISEALTGAGSSADIRFVKAIDLDNDFADLKAHNDPAYADLHGTLTADDCKHILSLDPFYQHQLVKPDPARFVPVKMAVDVSGPNQAGGTVVLPQFSVSDSQVAGQIKGSAHTFKESIFVGGGFSFFVNFSAKVGVTLQQSYSKTSATEQGRVQSAAAELGSQTVGFHQLADVYLDTLFGTFAFVDEARPASGEKAAASIVGQLVDDHQRPLAARVVSVRTADGVLHLTGTQADGSYAFYRLPAGKATLQVENQAPRGVSVSVAKPAKPLKMPPIVVGQGHR